MNDPDPGTYARAMERTSLAGFLGTVILGGLGLLGWLSGWRAPASVLPQYVPMAPSTAVCFLLLGATGLFRTCGRGPRLPVFLQVLALVFVTAVGLTDALEFLGVTGTDLEQLLFPDPEGLHGLPWAKMSPMTGGLFLFSGLMMLSCLIRSVSDRRPPLPGHVAGLLSVVVVFSAFTILLGYAYGTPFLYGSQVIPVAAPTALAFLLLGIAVLSGLGHDGIPNRYFSGATIRARLVRVFVPLVFVAVIVQGIVHRIREFNNEAERLHGRTREEILGKSYLDLFASDDLRDMVVGQVREALAGLPTRGFESPLSSGNGEVRTLIWHVDVLPGADGEPQGVLAVGMDITERKRAERERESLRNQLFQAQKMEALGTLSGGIAHDFNNLLHVIMGYSDFLLTDAPLSDELRADLRKINKAAQNGAELVRGLLTLSRKGEPRLRPVNINVVVDQVTEILLRTIPKTIELKLFLADEVALIHADPVQIEQVLMNLGINARDAMPEGGTLTIEARNITLDEEYCQTHLDALPGDYVLLSVSDTGHGMDKHTMERIFEPFFTTKGPGEGTGLGLAMVYGIVKQHRGHINCYSEACHGTRFTISFPVMPAEERTKDTESVEVLPRGKETILVVDDEELVRELAEGMLRRYGYAVMTATNGRDALELYQKERARISLVILDLIMPKMGGDRCLQEILSTDPDAKVVIASGYSSKGSAREALAAGARGFVAKPYQLKQLVTTVRTILDQN